MLGEVKQFAKLRKDGRCLRSEAWSLKGMDLVPGSKNPTLLLVVAKFPFLVLDFLTCQWAVLVPVSRNCFEDG